MSVNLKTEKDIQKLVESGKILVRILKALKKEAREGVILSDLDSLAKKMLDENKAKAAFFGYTPSGANDGFPGHICASVNDQVVHGVPGDYKLRNGDLLKIDFGVEYKSMITDAALSVPIGNISDEVDNLSKTTFQALQEAIKVCKPGNHIGDIGWIVEQTVTERGFSIVKPLGGHGVGFSLHEKPTIYNFGEKGTGLEITEGMVLAIEPITSLGSGDIKNGPQESYITTDGTPSAHSEATIAVTKNGNKVLTPWWK